MYAMISDPTDIIVIFIELAQAFPRMQNLVQKLFYVSEETKKYMYGECDVKESYT